MDKMDEQFYTARGYEISARENALTASMEDYLEMIYRLSQKNGYTRVNDLAESLNVQPPSVTKMIQKLSEKYLLEYEKYGMIHLTSEGKKLGQYFLDRHNTLREFLTLIKATDNLQKDVETMEHYFSFNNYRVISALVGFMKDNQHFLKDFYKYKEAYLKENPREPQP
ncbi:Mn-dependent DtxR family transcriptional regulator [Desulfitispora alkaliphila]|uniref:transcriptional regulator MntR n=1 Tax=Desulfitispora alkaliphila TaxID=622674 RepID=UPI003D1C5A27